jgi:Flp pilus assembly protein TadD
VSKHKTDDDSGAGAVAAKQLSIPAAMDLAMRRHGAGNLAEAEAIYRRVLSAEPDNPFALHLLGVAAHQGGDHEGARGLIEKAIAAKPDFLEAFSNLGLVAAGPGPPRGRR